MYEVIFRDEFDYTILERSFEEFETVDDACEYIESMRDKDGSDDMIDDSVNVWNSYTRTVEYIDDSEYKETVYYLIKRI